MESLKKAREIKEISQRNLADLAGISYKSLHLVEGGECDPKLSTLDRIARALDYPPRIIHNQIETLFATPPHSISMISARICEEGEKSWKIWLFNFVDSFRRHKTRGYIDRPPLPELPEKIQNLLAATVETLCDELFMGIPLWCHAMPVLSAPWFIAEVENLKALVLVESPVHFRKRNLFVLANFLDRV